MMATSDENTHTDALNLVTWSAYCRMRRTLFCRTRAEAIRRSLAMDKMVSFLVRTETRTHTFAIRLSSSTEEQYPGFALSTLFLF
jgi:hypothetical protein